MIDDQRPSPEYLLSLIKKETAKEKGGKLKIFFGMAAGVGKTFAMLETAQQLIKEGIDVVIGTIDTHGRKETAALMENIPIIPKKIIQYKETEFEEMDLDGILARKPQIVLVDELAHSNIPGSRHPKRWQDVMDILEAGIDVYTTLNVQHLESLQQSVESVTGLRVRETVPDSIFERAYEIELVDISPTKLLKRLKEGKVYLGSHPQMAAEHFFKEERLTALREIALRYVAEKVDHDLQSFVTTTESSKTYAVSDRLMVAVSPSPHSEYLIRAAKRIAYMRNIPWTALYIDSGKILSSDEQKRLAKNLTLARDLGAEVVTTTHPNIASAIKLAIKEYQITQLVIGRPGEQSLYEIWEGGTLLDHVARENRDTDLVVVRQQPHLELEKETSVWRSYFKLPKKYTYYWAVLALITLLTLFNLTIVSIVGWKSIGFIYLLGILTLSLFTGRGPILFAAFLSAVMLDLFFIPPMGAMSIHEIEDLIFFGVYLFTALITGILVTRVKHREEMLIASEEYTQLLYLIEREIASAPSPHILFDDVSHHLSTMFKGEFGFAIFKKEDQLIFEETNHFSFDNKEKAVALWTIKNGKAAGWSTDTLPSVETLFIPLKGVQSIVGVMGFRPQIKIPLRPEQMNLLTNIAQRLASYIERYLNEQDQKKAAYMKQVENLQQNIFNIISEQFSVPLNSIIASIQSLSDSREKQEISNSVEKLYYIVKNFKDMAKLRTDMLKIQKERYNLAHFVELVLKDFKKFANDHQIVVDIPENLPDIYFDFSLLELAVMQILKNAVTYTPQGTKIYITAKLTGDTVMLSIADEGPGIPPELLNRIFDRFYRIPGTSATGTGLGLALAKSIVEIHGGTIEASNRPEGGAEFRIYLNVGPL